LSAAGGLQRPRFAARPGSARWIATLSALTGVTALSIDMSLPAQPTLGRAFHAGSDDTQLTLSLFLVGYAVGQLVSGSLSDARGRRVVLLGGLGVFTVAGLACSVSTSLSTLVILRMVQGLGAAAAPVVARAMVRDTQPSTEAARLLATMTAVLAIAPMVAPLAGGWLLTHLGWQSIFGALAAVGVVLAALSALTLEETRPKALRTALSFAAVLRGFLTFFRTPGTRVPTLLACASFAGQFAFISDSPFVIIDGYGVPAEHYGFYFGSTAVMLMAGSLTSGHLVKRGFTPRALLGVGAALLCTGGVLLAILVRVPALGVAGLMGPMMIYFIGIGFVGPNATAIAMAPVPALAGTASALIGFLQMAAGALSGYVATRVGGKDPATLGLITGAMGLFAALLVAVTLVQAGRGRRAERRRAA
jgi:DHA1 family bicyclomycin/chloramphenicol resistance-like MFS transporter